jgi:hypothetical protein
LKCQSEKFSGVAVDDDRRPGSQLILKQQADAGAMDPYDAAEALMWLATLPSDGATGGFFRGRNVIPW